MLINMKMAATAARGQFADGSTSKFVHNILVPKLVLSPKSG